MGESSVETHSESQSTDPSGKRLLVLDVDNTLLHAPHYDPMLFALAGVKLSRDEFYGGLPDGGIPLEEGSMVKVYHRKSF
jgi:hypothetical protein